jgi:hypothetical protein
MEDEVNKEWPRPMDSYDTITSNEMYLALLKEKLGFDVRSALDDIARERGIASSSDYHQSMADFLRGFNRLRQGSPIAGNRDHQGMVFFTRPDLNLSDANLSASRYFSPLLTKNTATYQSAARVMLDPVFGSRYGSHPLIDPLQAFMVPFSNAILNVSGWPDESINVARSTPGIAKEVHIMNDSIAEFHGDFSLSLELQNIQGSFILMVIRMIMLYSGFVYIGKMQPRISNLIENRIDYMTRVYRITFDPTGRYVSHIAICNAGVFEGVSSGMIANYDRSITANDEVSKISVGLACTGFYLDDPILIEEFNTVVCMCNPDMANGMRHRRLRKLLPFEYASLNWQGYPHIDEDTHEFSWWVYNQ